MHLDLAAEQARRAGDDDGVRRRAVLMRTGGVSHAMDALRDQRGVPWLDALMADLVFGWRQLNKRRAVSVAAVLSLGLAIGAAAAAIRLIDAVLLRSLPVDRPDRLFAVATTFIDAENRPDYRDYFDYPTFRQYSTALNGHADALLLGMTHRPEAVVANGREPEAVYRQFVSGNVFPSFGLDPALGRLISPADDLTPGAHPVAVLSHEYWTRRFARDAAALGRTLRIGAYTYEIIGVAPPGFVGTEPGLITDVFVPASMNVAALNSPGWSWFRLWVRPKDGVAPQSVRDRLQAIFAETQRAQVTRLPAGTPAAQIDAVLRQEIRLLPAGAGVSVTQKTYRRPLWILGILVGLVLLIACANVANLLIAQTEMRAREMALRVAIGAGRRRLIQLVLVEGSLLAIAASVFGLLFAAWAAPFVVSRLAPPDQPLRLVLAFDWRAAAIGIALIALVTGLFALAPALRASSAAPMLALRTRDESRSHRRWTHTLVAIQAAFCVFVLFVAGLLVTTFAHLSRRSLGFNPDGVVLMDASVRGKPRPADWWSTTLDQLRQAPGIRSIAFAGWAPLSGNAWSINIRAPGRPFESRSPWALDVSSGFFETLRIGVLAGRDFRPGDRQPGIQNGMIVSGVAIVNESFARTYFDGLNPVGRTALVRVEKGEAAVEIVGWVRDASYRGVRDPMRPTVYFPLEPRQEGTLLVRAIDAASAGAALRGEIPRIDPDLRLSDDGTQAALVDRQMIRERLLSMLSWFFAAVGLLLAGVGLYGVLHFAVTERRREIGVRLALGAKPLQVIRGVTSPQISMVAMGALAGLAIGLACSGIFEALLFEVTPLDPGSLAGPVLALAAAALLAAFPPAVRAIRMDPAETLRID